MVQQVIITAFLFQLLFFDNAIAYEKVLCPKVSQAVTNLTYFLYYFGPTVNDYYRVPFENALSIAEQDTFNKNIETVLYLPGWGENPSQNTESTDTIAAAFLQEKVANLIIADYHEFVKNNNLLYYVSSVGNVTTIGEALACFLHKFIPDVQAIDYIRLVGHSLGGQIMSRTAICYGQGELPRLTALDPAGPLFNIPFIENSLSKKDGRFVDVIHTDAYLYGDGGSIGHVDFWPNKGIRIQPHCETDDNNFCSHHMSWRYYAASIVYPMLFPAQACDKNVICLTIDMKICCKANSVVAYMGYYVNKTARNNFYLKTGDQYPFGIGDAGFYSQ